MLEADIPGAELAIDFEAVRFEEELASVGVNNESLVEGIAENRAADQLSRSPLDS